MEKVWTRTVVSRACGMAKERRAFSRSSQRCQVKLLVGSGLMASWNGRRSFILQRTSILVSELHAHSLCSLCVCAFRNSIAPLPATLPPLTVCLPVRLAVLQLEDDVKAYIKDAVASGAGQDVEPHPFEKTSSNYEVTLRKPVGCPPCSNATIIAIRKS